MSADSTVAIVLNLLGRLLPGARAVTAIKASALAGGILLLAGLALLAAAGMGCAALWAAVAPSFGPAGASLAVAGVLVLLALVLLSVAWRVLRRGTPPAPSGIPPEQINAVLKALGDLVGEHKAGALVAALLAGAAAEQAARR